jgi:carboxylesterase type B
LCGSRTGWCGAEKLAAQGDVVVVTFNYRLSVFGFLAHPALAGGRADHLSGNLGIEDQQAVLRGFGRTRPRSAATRTTSRCSGSPRAR